MRFAILLLPLFVSSPAVAQDQLDEAHRADQLRTQALNARSANGSAPGAPVAADTAGYAAARADYQRRLAEWRRRVAACEAGYYEACRQ